MTDDSTLPPQGSHPRSENLGLQESGTGSPQQVLPDDVTIISTQRYPAEIAPNSAAAETHRISEKAEPLQKLEPGYVINNMYQVLEALDQGGMGRVFRGRETGTGEPVAIKVILPEIADDKKAADMFRREARTLRLLHHDAIVRYFAYLPPDENLNLHALVMGFIEGTKLSGQIKNHGGLSLPDVCRLFIRLTDGLIAAHEIGVVHRDLSPDNVMLPDDNIDKAVLIDFGISRSSTIKDVTLGNEFAGKLKYVSPEQLGAFGGEADQRSDVYSLGLLMFVAITGEAAPMGSTIVEAVKVRETVPDLSFVPSTLQPLLFQMLQPDPSRRIGNMTLVKQFLLQINDGGTSLRPQSPDLTAGFTMTTTATNRPVDGLQAAPAIGDPTLSQLVNITDRQPQAQTSAENTEKKSRKRGGVFWSFFFVVFGAVGVLGWAMWGDVSTWVSDTEQEEAKENNLARIPGEKETFLVEATAPGCAFATYRQFGHHKGQIEGFHLPSVTLSGLTTAWSSKFGSDTDLVEHTVDQIHCPALVLARLLQGTKGEKIEVNLSSNLLTRRDEISGTVLGMGDRAGWLAIVTPRGLVYSLTSRLDKPIGDERHFRFRIRSGTPGKYLLISVASNKALVRTGAMQDGTAASDIFELIGRELAKDGQGAVDIGFVNLLP